MAETIAPAARLAATPAPRLSAWQQASLSLFWFASSAHWTAILTTLLPLQALRIGGEGFQGTTLGQILGIGALVSMVVAPLFGAWSDRVRWRWGRRKPFLVIGTIGNVVSLLVLAFVPSAPAALLPYILAYMAINLFNNLATAPYSALIPELVPPAQRGSASGWMGLMQMFGNLIGAITGIILGVLGTRFGEPGAITLVYIGLAVILVIGLVGTLSSFREPEPPALPAFHLGTLLRSIFDPFKSRDFSWVFWTRFLMTLGTFTVQGFILFYMKDVIAGGAAQHSYRFFGVELATEPAAAGSFFLLGLLLGAVASSLVAGKLSDRYGRKPMVYLSGAVQALVMLALIFNRSFEVGVLLGLVFGLGYGAYIAVDWALGSDVLPSQDDYAKDMGVWHIAMTLPQSIATPIAGVLLDTFQGIGRASEQPTLGYSVIFGLAFVYFVLGTVLVYQVKGTR